MVAASSCQIVHHCCKQLPSLKFTARVAAALCVYFSSQAAIGHVPSTHRAAQILYLLCLGATSRDSHAVLIALSKALSKGCVCRTSQAVCTMQRPCWETGRTSSGQTTCSGAPRCRLQPEQKVVQSMWSLQTKVCTGSRPCAFEWCLMICGQNALPGSPLWVSDFSEVLHPCCWLLPAQKAVQSTWSLQTKVRILHLTHDAGDGMHGMAAPPL